MRLFSDKPETIGSVVWAARLREAITAARWVMGTITSEDSKVQASSYRVSSFWVGFFADQYYKKRPIPGYSMRYHFKAKSIYVHSFNELYGHEHAVFRNALVKSSEAAKEGSTCMVITYDA